MNPTATMDTISVTLNGQSVEVTSGTTVLEAARQTGLSIPTLCAHPGLPTLSTCRVCLVEIEGEEQLQAACSYPLTESVSISTHSPRVLASRRMTVELMMARTAHDTEPHTGQEPFQQLVYELGIRHQRFLPTAETAPLDTSSPALVFNPNACIQCGLCVSACNDMQEVHAINFAGRGVHQSVQAGFQQNLVDTECNACGQCIAVCPTGAFQEQDHTSDVMAALADDSKFVIAAVLPVVGVSIGTEFGMAAGADLSGQLVNGLKNTGFDMVFNAGFGYDLHAMETAFELRHRMMNEEHLPLIISSCPSLVKQMEHQHPDLIPNLSVNRSPSQMFGRLLKTYYADQLERSPADIVVVQVTPNVSSKLERTRHELDGVDVSITTREVARLLRTASGYDLTQLASQPFDAPFNDVTGAGIRAAVSGGMAEAILRTIGELMTGADLDESAYEGIRGAAGIREAEITVGDNTLRVAVASDLGHGNRILERVKDGETAYHLIEITDGGQPVTSDQEAVQHVIDTLIQIDQASEARKPRANMQLNHIYAEFLKSPFGEKSQDLLQTVYTKRGRY